MPITTPKINICKACQQEVSDLKFGYCSACDKDMAKADLHLAIRNHIPKDWRIGQFIANFLIFLNTQKDTLTQVGSIADPFHLSDEDFIKYWFEYIKEIK